MQTTLPEVAPMDGAEFKRLRQFLGLSQDQLGRVLDRTGKTIYMWERDGAQVDPTAALAIRKLVEDAGMPRSPYKRSKRAVKKG